MAAASASQKLTDESTRTLAWIETPVSELTAADGAAHLGMSPAEYVAFTNAATAAGDAAKEKAQRIGDWIGTWTAVGKPTLQNVGDASADALREKTRALQAVADTFCKNVARDGANIRACFVRVKGTSFAKSTFFVRDGPSERAALELMAIIEASTGTGTAQAQVLSDAEQSKARVANWTTGARYMKEVAALPPSAERDVLQREIFAAAARSGLMASMMKMEANGTADWHGPPPPMGPDDVDVFGLFTKDSNE